ncbi:unnamed protein product [Thlaspi arvense]|uniref:Uncharacterized protein n=1 Tax=Thlaspi arvense TaxID=13288 RepID=A0AAU9SD51_THLAR|nr:unnamed protein product [Thlaspi arvense]
MNLDMLIIGEASYKTNLFQVKRYVVVYIKEASDHVERNYEPIFQIIDEKVKGKLDSPLYVAAYSLNLFYCYKDPIIYDFEVIQAFISCGETLSHGDFEKQDFVVNKELSLYRNKCGSFGISLAIKGCEKKDDKFDPQEDVVDMEFEPDVYQEDPVFYEAQPA